MHLTQSSLLSVNDKCQKYGILLHLNLAFIDLFCKFLISNPQFVNRLESRYDSRRIMFVALDQHAFVQVFEHRPNWTRKQGRTTITTSLSEIQWASSEEKNNVFTNENSTLSLQRAPTRLGLKFEDPKILSLVYASSSEHPMELARKFTNSKGNNFPPVRPVRNKRESSLSEHTLTKRNKAVWPRQFEKTSGWRKEGSLSESSNIENTINIHQLRFFKGERES